MAEIDMVGDRGRAYLRDNAEYMFDLLLMSRENILSFEIAGTPSPGTKKLLDSIARLLEPAIANAGIDVIALTERRGDGEAVSLRLPDGFSHSCSCFRCTKERVEANPLPREELTFGVIDPRLSVMFLCQRCGNKRCPHATDHRLVCTASNLEGQEGSSYGPPLKDVVHEPEKTDPEVLSSVEGIGTAVVKFIRHTLGRDDSPEGLRAAIERALPYDPRSILGVMHKSPIDDRMTKFLDGVCGAVEANSYEKLMLWSENHDKYDWVNNNAGLGETIGWIGDLPVCLSLFTSEVDGKKILFYETTSRASDAEMVDAWLERALPASARLKSGRINKDNAMNFHGVLRDH